MRTLNTALNWLFDALLGSLRMESPWPAMVVVSLVATVLILLIFKATSNPRIVQRRKNRAIARLIEFALFKDDIVVNLGAFGRGMTANLAYVGTLILPLLASLIPVVLILAQIAFWFSARPLRTGETTVLTVCLSNHLSVMEQSMTLTPSPGITVDSGPVRAPSRNEVSWRLRVAAAGAGWVDLTVNGTAIRKSVAADRRIGRLAPLRPPAGFWTELTNPGEAPLPDNSPLVAITVQYPPTGLELGGRSHHWLLVFCVLTLVFGILLLKPLRVVI